MGVFRLVVQVLLSSAFGEESYLPSWAGGFASLSCDAGIACVCMRVCSPRVICRAFPRAGPKAASQ